LPDVKDIAGSTTGRIVACDIATANDKRKLTNGIIVVQVI
jgi:hypothetical protein